MNVNRVFSAVLTAVALVLSSCVAVPPAPEPSPLRVMSYNIRYNNPADGINAWPHRKDSVAEMIGARHRADLAGLQEALRDQIDDLADRLPDHGWTGVGRDDGGDAGEFSPIFYRRERIEFLEGGTFWLSETPEVPGSRSWDAAITRIVTWARFEDRSDGGEFYVFNTHFDHRGQEARVESARLLLKRISEVSPGYPVILTGDLNVREDNPAYRILTEGEPEADAASVLLDARYASLTGHQGPTASFNDWVEQREPESRIDYILVRRGIRVLSHRILDDRFDGRFPSDHLPVLAEVALSP
jgi:endonuclease/exonuclease/phosphatase family metal-dependent hydrolase